MNKKTRDQAPQGITSYETELLPQNNDPIMIKSRLAINPIEGSETPRSHVI